METIFIPLNPYQTGAPSPNRRMSNILRQYEEFQTKHSDAVILFKCTNIYKTFNVSAKVCAKVLGVELKSYDKDNWYVEFLHYALDIYLAKLVRSGKRVCICEDVNCLG